MHVYIRLYMYTVSCVYEHLYTAHTTIRETFVLKYLAKEQNQQKAIDFIFLIYIHRHFRLSSLQSHIYFMLINYTR